MRKPALTKAIYAELRATLGEDVAAGDLLRLAHLIVRAHAEERDELAEYGRPGGGNSFASLPVDDAMRDGGWRILAFESQRLTYLDDVDRGAIEALRPLIERYLGPEWQQQLLTGQL